jgi:hypothetical protein
MSQNPRDQIGGLIRHGGLIGVSTELQNRNQARGARAATPSPAALHELHYPAALLCIILQHYNVSGSMCRARIMPAPSRCGPHASQVVNTTRNLKPVQRRTALRLDDFHVLLP